jgi:hypothetical protein
MSQENEPMSDDRPSKSFFLVIADHDQGFFSVEGPMTDGQPWNNAARHARDNLHRHVVRGPAGSDRDALVAKFLRAGRFAASCDRANDRVAPSHLSSTRFVNHERGRRAA